MDVQSWRKNLYVIAFTEFLAICGFTLISPFLPLYLQRFGSFTSDEAAVWSGIAIGGAGIGMFISAPLWGLVSDRLGRKPMFLRSLFGGAVVIGLLGLVTNVYVFIGLRVLQGVFAGTVAAGAALVTTTTPGEKVRFSIGLLMGAVYAGDSFGPLIGGFLADHFGFTTTFFVTSVLLMIGGLMVLFLTRENMKPPEQEQRSSLLSTLRLAVSPELFPLLLIITAINIGPQMIFPIVSLVLKDVNPGGDIASTTGLAFTLIGITASISSFMIGRLPKRFSLKNILIISCLFVSLLFLPPIWANTITWIIITVGLTGLVDGAAITSANLLVNFSVPANLKGVAYGLSQSAAALGRGLGPIIGGGLGSLLGLRSVFGAVTGIYILAGLLGVVLLFRMALPEDEVRQ